MPPQFLVFGNLTREYLLSTSGQSRLDMPGGSLLYTAAGLKVWESEIGLVARVGDDFPRTWLNECRSRGFDTSGVKLLPGPLDVRDFIAISETLEANRINPIAHFSRRGMTVPKSLMGYQSSHERTPDERRNLLVSDIPEEYLLARAAMICPMELSVQNQLIAGLKRGQIHTFVIDPAADEMKPPAKRRLPAFLNGVTALLLSQEKLRSLFWGKTHDLWEMAEAVSLYGCEYVIIKCGGQGQLLYRADNKRRLEIPAYPARIADPVGAGHAFNGGFLAGYCRNYDPIEGVLYGSVSASLKLEGIGAYYPLDVMPGLAEARLEAVRRLVREV